MHISGLQVMNLFFKSYKFCLFFLLICAVRVPVLLGQTPPDAYPFIPEILKFNIPSKYNKTPNTSLARNNDGITFVGKENALLVIDNEKIYYNPSPSPVFVSISTTGNIIYLTENDLGFIEYRESEGPVQISLNNQIPSHAALFFPLDICSLHTQTFMLTSEGVFVLSHKKLNFFFFNRLPCTFLKTGKDIFLNVENKGLFYWSGSEFTKVLSENEVSEIIPHSIYKINNGFRLITKTGKIFILDPINKTLKPGRNQNIPAGGFSQYLIKDSIYLCNNNQNQLSIHTTGEKNCIPLYTSGMLPAKYTNSVFVDNFGDIWLVYDFNIFKLEYPSQTTTLDLSDLINETFLSTSVSENGLYVSSNNGLFLLKEISSDLIVPEEIKLENNSNISDIASVGRLVIASGNDGLYQIRGIQASMIDDGNFFISAPLNDTTIIATNENGIFKYSYHENIWNKYLVSDKISNILSYKIFEDACWMLSNDRTIYKYDGEKLNAYSINLQGLNEATQLIIYKNILYITGNNTSFSWDKNSGQFLQLGNKTLPGRLKNSDLIINSNDHLWYSKKNASGANIIREISPDLINVPYFKVSERIQFGDIVDIDESDTYLWITGNCKIIRLDKNVSETQSLNPIKIQSVVYSSASDNLIETQIKENEKLKYIKNNVTIQLKSLRYIKSTYLYYRYKINHYQEEWSDWSSDNTIVLSNLHERKYTFQAQSLSSHAMISEPVEFKFSISAPFYRKWYAYLIYSLVFLFSAFLIYKWRLLNLKKGEFKVEERIREKLAAVLDEKEKSDKLVEDLFPKGTADEIKESGRAKSKKFEMATVLFSDIQGFTKIAEEMNPEVLIDELDKFFFHFDSVVEKYNIEKIKTIGDAYMAAGGIPVKNSSNPVEVVLAGLEMQYYMNDLKKKKTDIWDLRIGIHTGPIISGVVGHKKLSYDIWGDTVNTASRMESSGEPGKVNISGMTYTKVKDYFLCEYRGKLPVKYKGNIDMYFVTGLRPELSVDLHGIPNKRFFIKLQLLKFNDLEERVLENILSDPTLNLSFHKHEYLHRVCNQTELLCKSENLTDDELLLTKTAVIMLYTGLSETYENYENRSVEIARNLLPEFDYSEKQIERICNLILAAKEPYNPQNKLEEILIDSKMDYIGRSDYMTQIKLLFLEKKGRSKDISQEKFIRQQVHILRDFEFYTTAALRLREVSPEKQIARLESWK